MPCGPAWSGSSGAADRIPQGRRVGDTGAMARGDGASVDVFISYTPADVRWATWIAWQIERSGHRAIIQAWDFVPGTQFIDSMDRGLRTAWVMVAVLSPRYLTAE